MAEGTQDGKASDEAWQAVLGRTRACMGGQRDGWLHLPRMYLKLALAFVASTRRRAPSRVKLHT